MADGPVTSYAEAIVAIASGEDALGVVEDELLSIARAVEANPELARQLADVQVPVGQRLKFAESDAVSAAHPATRTALATVIAGDRASELVAIAKKVAELAADARSREVAEVAVAAPIDDAQKEQLRLALERATGKQLEVKVFVDPSVLGGVRARIGDTVIDGSVARRLADARTRLGGTRQ